MILPTNAPVSITIEVNSYGKRAPQRAAGLFLCLVAKYWLEWIGNDTILQEVNYSCALTTSLGVKSSRFPSL